MVRVYFWTFNSNPLYVDGLYVNPNPQHSDYCGIVESVQVRESPLVFFFFFSRLLAIVVYLMFNVA
jgi:hypothetical protein